jgi:2-oxo-4-hydroxy-4-carboxy-5-ureidoimidazoline decarboxylase
MDSIFVTFIRFRSGALRLMAVSPHAASERMKRLTLQTLNQCSEEDFVQSLAEVFEHLSWVARYAFKARLFRSLQHLHATMFDVVRHANETIQREFLCVHPELAGREAQQGSLTENS